MVMVMVFFYWFEPPETHPQWEVSHRLQIEVFQTLTSHPHRAHGLLEPFDEFVVLDDAILVFVGLESECFSVEHRWWMVG